MYDDSDSSVQRNVIRLIWLQLIHISLRQRKRVSLIILKASLESVVLWTDAWYLSATDIQADTPEPTRIHQSFTSALTSSSGLSCGVLLLLLAFWLAEFARVTDNTELCSCANGAKVRQSLSVRSAFPPWVVRYRHWRHPPSVTSTPPTSHATGIRLCLYANAYDTHFALFVQLSFVLEDDVRAFWSLSLPKRVCRVLWCNGSGR